VYCIVITYTHCRSVDYSNSISQYDNFGSGNERKISVGGSGSGGGGGYGGSGGGGSSDDTTLQTLQPAPLDFKMHLFKLYIILLR